MNQHTNMRELEKDLLSYTEMCYSVALALTHDRFEAEDLARHVLMRAWLTHNRPGSHRVTKEYLLTGLRKRYLEDRRKSAEEISTDKFPPLRLADEVDSVEDYLVTTGRAASCRTSCRLSGR